MRVVHFGLAGQHYKHESEACDRILGRKKEKKKTKSDQRRHKHPNNNNHYGRGV